MQAIEHFMKTGEYYNEPFDKTSIYLHHTNGSHRPDDVINAWDSDVVDEKIGKKTVRIIGSAYVIGGKSNADSTFDGKIYQAFPEKFWCHHLGSTYANNRKLNQLSIGIELCNFGPLKKGSDGCYYTSSYQKVSENDVTKLSKPFKGYTYFHSYTDAQLASLQDLLKQLKVKFPKIEMRTPLLSIEGFDLNDNAKKCVPGIYSHSNIRVDKSDVSPQPNLISALKELCT